jgi:ferric-dicitrate binding protein FerR (iron transport regulator)
MKTASDNSRSSRVLTAFTEVVRDGAEPRTPVEIERGLSSLLARIDSNRARRRVTVRWGLVRWALFGGAAAMCFVIGVGATSYFQERMHTSASPTPGYRIEGGSVLEGGYLRERGHTGIKLSFSEGSKLVLLPGTRGRLRTVDENGARVAIENGTASFQVNPAAHRRWSVEVGPFLVTVKGTVFTVAWDPSSEQFELRLRHGRVVVSGPVSGGEIALRAGQRLRVSLPRAETLITEERPEDLIDALVAAPAPVETGAPVTRPSETRDKPAVPKASGVASPSPIARARDERRWAEKLARGNWDRILEDVERTGIATALAEASSEDLFALANAARYRRRTDLARAALLAERRRFPESPRALDAVFLLGRVEESRERGTQQALAWYDEYLALAPTGVYAAEALGRKMTLTNDLGGQGKARTIAEEYLRRFPDGSYAGSARALRGLP